MTGSTGEPERRVFLDANVLFSTALGGASFAELWQALRPERFVVCTSPQCVDEARRNLTKKRPAALPRLDETLARVVLSEAPEQLVDWAQGKLPEDDGWVLAGAVAAKAQVLITGNTKHFGYLMNRSDLPLRVCTVRGFLEALTSFEETEVLNAK